MSLLFNIAMRAFGVNCDHGPEPIDDERLEVARHIEETAAAIKKLHETTGCVWLNEKQYVCAGDPANVKTCDMFIMGEAPGSQVAINMKGELFYRMSCRSSWVAFCKNIAESEPMTKDLREKFLPPLTRRLQELQGSTRACKPSWSRKRAQRNLWLNVQDRILTKKP